MKDLQAMVNIGIALTAIGLVFWLFILIAFNLIVGFVMLLRGMFNLNSRLTRMNPYITAHKKMLAQQEDYEEYVAKAKKDGTAILIDPPVFSRYINTNHE